ncbi:MAG: hypothetical protein AAF267_22715 [Deinococcota bacterium]
MRIVGNPITSFIGGFLMGVIAMWASTFLAIPFWQSAIGLVVIVFVIVPLLRWLYRLNRKQNKTAT